MLRSVRPIPSPAQRVGRGYGEGRCGAGGSRHPSGIITVRQDRDTILPVLSGLRRGRTPPCTRERHDHLVRAARVNAPVLQLDRRCPMCRSLLRVLLAASVLVLITFGQGVVSPALARCLVVPTGT